MTDRYPSAAANSPFWAFEHRGAYASQTRPDDGVQGARRAIEHELRLSGASEVLGYCFACDGPRQFRLHHPDEELTAANAGAAWRETVICTTCRLNNRQRAALHHMASFPAVTETEGRSVYLTEQVTPLFDVAQTIFSNVVGSEYLDDPAAHPGVRHEDITQLTFADESFDLIGSFDVLEHLPNWQGALREFARVTRPGGTCVLSIPFALNADETSIRAVADETQPDGIRHLLEPIYHGDPVRKEGILCWQIFGWDLLDELKAAGFARANVVHYWSNECAYYGWHQLLIVGEKAA